MSYTLGVSVPCQQKKDQYNTANGMKCVTVNNVRGLWLILGYDMTVTSR